MLVDGRPTKFHPSGLLDDIDVATWRDEPPPPPRPRNLHSSQKPEKDQAIALKLQLLGDTINDAAPPLRVHKSKKSGPASRTRQARRNHKLDVRATQTDGVIVDIAAKLEMLEDRQAKRAIRRAEKRAKAHARKKAWREKGESEPGKHETSTSTDRRNRIEQQDGRCEDGEEANGMMIEADQMVQGTEGNDATGPFFFNDLTFRMK